MTPWLVSTGSLVGGMAISNHPYCPGSRIDCDWVDGMFAVTTVVGFPQEIFGISCAKFQSCRCRCGLLDPEYPHLGLIILRSGCYVYSVTVEQSMSENAIAVLASPHRRGSRALAQSPCQASPRRRLGVVNKDLSNHTSPVQKSTPQLQYQQPSGEVLGGKENDEVLPKAASMPHEAVDDDEEEVFFGAVTQNEQKKAKKLRSRRRTMLYRVEVSPSWLMSCLTCAKGQPCRSLPIQGPASS